MSEDIRLDDSKGDTSKGIKEAQDMKTVLNDLLENNKKVEDLKSAQDADMLTELNRQRMAEHRQRMRDDRYEFGEEFLIPNPRRYSGADREPEHDGLDGRRRGLGPNYIRRG